MATSLAIASPVDAQEVSRSITITRDSKLGTQAITKGDYSVKFSEGKDGELILFKGKKEVAKVAYKSAKLSQPAPDNTVAYTAAGDGSFQVKRIEFKGKSDAIVLD